MINKLFENLVEIPSEELKNIKKFKIENDLVGNLKKAMIEALKRDIKANAIMINANYASLDFIQYFQSWYGVEETHYKGILGMNVYFTKNELPNDVSYMIFETGETQKQKELSDYTTEELLKELLKRNEG